MRGANSLLQTRSFLQALLLICSRFPFFSSQPVMLILPRRMNMCRSIKPLFNFNPPVTPDEIRAASLQFVRKISGFHKPSKANAAAFELAIDEITAASHRLLRSLETSASPRNRELEAAKAKARFHKPVTTIVLDKLARE